MQGYVFTLNTEGGIPLRYHDTMERLLCYLGKNYKYSIYIQKLVEDMNSRYLTFQLMLLSQILIQVHLKYE